MNIHSIFIFLLIFLSVFKLKIGLFDITYLILALSIFLILFKRFELKIDKKIILVLSSIILIQIYTLISTLISQHDNLFYVVKYTRVILSFLSTYIIFNYLLSKYSYKRLLKILGYVLITHILLMWLQVFFPTFKEYIQSYLFSAGRNNWYRVTGLLNGTSSAGIFLGLSSVILFYLFLEFRERKFLYAYLISIPLYPLSAVTGFIISIAGIFYLLLKYRHIKLKNVTSLLLICGFVIFVFIFTYYADIEWFDKYGITEAQKRIILLFDDSVTVQHGNVLKSFDSLLNNYNIPEYGFPLLFGNIQPSKSEFATTISDAGIITNLHAYGILGFLILISSLILHNKISKNALMTALTLCYLILMFKNDLLFGRIIYDLYASVMFLSLKMQQKESVSTHL